MPIYSITDIVKNPLSKYTIEDIIKDLNELKQNGGITKIKDFNKLMNYFMKSKTFIKNNYDLQAKMQYAQMFDIILDMHPDNGIYTDEQILYLYENFVINKSIIDKFMNKVYILKYNHLHAYLYHIYTMIRAGYIDNDNELDVKPDNLIKIFVNRIDILEEEYTETMNRIDAQILFYNTCFPQVMHIDMTDDDKIYIRNFISKFRYFEKFYNTLTHEHPQYILYVSKKWIINNNIINKYINDTVFCNTITRYDMYKRISLLNYYEILCDQVFYNELKKEYDILDEQTNTTLICNLFDYFNPLLDDDIKDNYADFFEYYNNKFYNIIDKFKELNNKIIINDVLIRSKYCNDICKKYNINKLTIKNIDKKKISISVDIFEKMYQGEYNTELLNKCIKLKYNNNLLNYLLKTKHINFDNETLRYAIYTKNLEVITHMLNNKYNGSDKDLLYDDHGGLFSIDLRKLYKSYNILISDEVYKELRLRGYSVNTELCINADDKKHMKEIDDEIKLESHNIFPFDTYHTDFSFYYDMAKNGQLTLEIISKIHNVVSASGIQHLIRLYMEFNKKEEIENSIEKKIENENKPTKKIVKKVIKKVIKKVVKKNN
jgi:hypothetical protein